MRFADFPYERAQADRIEGELSLLIDEIKTAPDWEKAADILLAANRLYCEYADASNMAEIRYTQNTNDPFYSKEQEYYAEAGPKLQEKHSDFLRALLASPHLEKLKERFGNVYFTNAEIGTKTSSPEVLDLITQEGLLCMEYQKTLSEVVVDFRGEKLPMPRMGYYTSSADRDTRREAMTAVCNAMAQKGEAFNTIYDKLVGLRTSIAEKLGFDNYIQLGYLRMTRNCYTPEDVASFRRQVKKDIVPLVQKLRKAQAGRLGLDALTFYDEPVLRPEGNPKPVAQNEELYKIGIQLYRDMKPETREMVELMDEKGAFDLFSREGKMAGGYCSALNQYKMPFIFANFNGTAGDVEVFTHEGGHAFAFYTSRNHELPYENFPTMEACEIHSMSMEYLCWPWLERFYGEGAEAAKVIHLITSLYFIPYGCLVDEFQHHIYANPGLTPDERNELWLRLEQEYFPDMDYDGLPFYGEGRRWQRQLHIYLNPFYYIDYCIAGVCAMQIAAVMQTEGWDAAWEKYYAYTSMGGKYTLTELLDKAGLESPFVDGSLAKIVDVIRQYIDAHLGDL